MLKPQRLQERRLLHLQLNPSESIRRRGYLWERLCPSFFDYDGKNSTLLKNLRS